jgi:hypothetical protein
MNISGVIISQELLLIIYIYIYIYMVKENWNQYVFLELMKYKDSEQLSS